MTAIPKLAIALEDLTASKITPQEGFMLTRINGSYDLQSIVKISPMPQMEALLVFWRLLKAGHITLEEKKGLTPAAPAGRGRETCGLPRTAKRSGQAAAAPA